MCDFYRHAGVGFNSCRIVPLVAYHRFSQWRNKRRRTIQTGDGAAPESCRSMGAPLYLLRHASRRVNVDNSAQFKHRRFAVRHPIHESRYRATRGRRRLRRGTRDRAAVSDPIGSRLWSLLFFSVGASTHISAIFIRQRACGAGCRSDWRDGSFRAHGPARGGSRRWSSLRRRRI